ncbi:MAG TPA: hypothetical protein PLU71_01940 [Candidatus Dependentiae bacterium]|nr:hypothetical protein [Candidatus Dependentiae bacterium]HRQ62592.1 hypothetical protein [Candidatus Dependentiae bacterium]
MHVGPHWDVHNLKTGRHKNIFPESKEDRKGNNKYKLVLTCKEIWYFSALDEMLFFVWIQKIPSIKKFDGIGDELYLYFETDVIPDADLMELLALFYRYKIDIKQLSRFLTEDNKKWFYDNKKAFWHKKVFG